MIAIIYHIIDNLVNNVKLDASSSNNDGNCDTGAACNDNNDKSGKFVDVIRLKPSLIEDVFDRFFNFINTAIEIYVPSLVVNHDATYPAWFNHELLQLTQLKKSYHAAWQKFPEDDKPSRRLGQNALTCQGVYMLNIYWMFKRALKLTLNFTGNM